LIEVVFNGLLKMFVLIYLFHHKNQLKIDDDKKEKGKVIRIDSDA